MANNPYNNIVKLSDGTTIMDITDTTATASDVAQGKYFYAATGEKTLGTASGGGGAVVVTEEQLSGGGIAKHITAVDISDTTAVASDVAQGKYFYTSSGIKTAGTASGGGGGSVSADQVNFLDYDGTIVYSYTRTDALALSALPSNPSHTGLTAQGWNWSLANIKSYLTKYPDATVNVGQMYITDDGKTRLYVHFEERKSPWLQLYPNGTVVIDWGDNSATDTLTGTSVDTIKSVQHTYANSGDYIITLDVTGTARIQGSSSGGNGSHLLQKVSGINSAYESQVYRNAIRRIEFGSGIELYTYALRYTQSLECVTVPKYITSIGVNTFQYCYSLASLTIPDGVTSIGDYAFSACYSITSLNIPDSITSIGNFAFNSCTLASLTIPDGVTSIGNTVFGACYSITSLNIPDSITSIGNSAFANCYGMAEYHVLPTTPPTLGTSAFSNIQSDCIIYVPQESLEAYQTAQNWSTYASRMQGE